MPPEVACVLLGVVRVVSGQPTENAACPDKLDFRMNDVPAGENAMRSLLIE